MTDIIMVGCNGRMGQMISGLVKEDADCRIVAGIDIVDNRDNDYPVFTDIDACDVKADVIIDFSSANGFENIIVKGLRIYAYSSDSRRLDDFELFGGYRVGSAGFDRVFS